MRGVSIAVAIWFGFAGLAGAEAPRVITVNGEGSVAAAPDMATITLGVTQQAAEAVDAMDAASDSVAAILAELSASGIAALDMQTSGLSLQPLWSNRMEPSDSPPAVVGFVARNTVTVRVRDLSALGPVLDRVIRGGANTFDGLQFGLQKPGPLEAMARKLAVADAMARAADLAEAAGVRLGPVQSINENFQGRGPVMMEMAASRSKDVPIAAGELSLQGSVTMVFAIED